MEGKNFILDRIPHRPPFLWIDRIKEITEDRILAEKEIPTGLDLFKGHYPDNPILPGVMVCEAIFQAGALLISEIFTRNKEEILEGVPVLTRIQGAKFKRGVYPGDKLDLEASLIEKVGTAWFMKGIARVGGKISVKVEFACTLA